MPSRNFMVLEATGIGGEVWYELRKRGYILREKEAISYILFYSEEERGV